MMQDKRGAPAAEKGRNLGLDALRIASMLAVVGQHLILHGGLQEALSGSLAGSLSASFLYIACLFAVDGFVLITGYCQAHKPFRLRGLFRLWVQASVYNVLCTAAVNLRVLYPDMQYADMLQAVFPILTDAYWFFTTYFALMLLSPFLNRAFGSLSRGKALALLLALVLLFSVFTDLASLTGRDPFRLSGGCRLDWFVVLYLTGAYFGRYGAPRFGLALAGGAMGMNALLTLVLTVWPLRIPGMTITPAQFRGNNSLLVYLSAVGLLWWFARLPIRAESPAGRCIRFFAPLCFAVYLIHDNLWVRLFYIQALSPLPALAGGPWYGWLGMFFAEGAGIFLFGCLVEWVRRQLFRLLRIDPLCDRIADRIAALWRRLTNAIFCRIGGEEDF